MLGFTEKAVYCIAQTPLKDKQYPEKCKKRYWHSKAHKRTVKITRASGQCSGSGCTSIRDRYPGIGSVSILNGYRFIYFSPCHKNRLSIWLTELPNSQKMSYFEVKNYLHYCITNCEDFNLTLCRSVLKTLLNNITLKSFKTSVSFNI